MDRRTRAFIVVGIGVLATGAAFGYCAIQMRPVVQVPIAERFTVVASRAVPIGTQLTADMIRVVGWPDSPVVLKSPEVSGAADGSDRREQANLNPSFHRRAPAEVWVPSSPGHASRRGPMNDQSAWRATFFLGTRVDVIVTMRPAGIDIPDRAQQRQGA